jgi:hypothetical protein
MLKRSGMPLETSRVLDEALLDSLVGLHFIEGVHEVRAYGHPDDIDDAYEDDENDEDAGSHDEGDDGDDAYEDDEDDRNYDEGDGQAGDSTQIFIVTLDGEKLALFNRGDPVSARIGAARQGTWPLLPSAKNVWASAKNTSSPLMCHLFWRPEADLACDDQTDNGDRVLVAVAESSNLLVLEIGVERYSYLVPSVPLRMTIPMSSEALVPAGHSIRVIARPQLVAFRPSRIIVGNNADLWIVEDIRLDGRSQIVEALPGYIFAPQSVNIMLQLPVVQPGQTFDITARYIGGAPNGAPFLGAVFGEISPNPEPVTRIGRRFIARWTPEGRFEPWMAAHLPGRDPVTGEDRPA